MLVVEEKAALRARALAHRDGLDAVYREEASRRIADRILAMTGRFRDGPVSVFWPIRSEVETRPLMERLAAAGKELALPVVRKPRLIFHAWKPGEPLRTTGFGLSQPLAVAPEVVPATMLVPLAAFDRWCNRIGYGAAYYDSTIAALSERTPPLTIGLGFSTQRVERVPIEEHDRPLDIVVTEDHVFVRGEDRP
ncbi:MAG: 5-formyltetrahydrofolate cyclo-ligase [Methylobacteriaceae bacterium]|nr:5-formyltetrahydrofolate cyclo-ligase [Methylobacteriaceae bacterium]